MYGFYCMNCGLFTKKKVGYWFLLRNLWSFVFYLILKTIKKTWLAYNGWLFNKTKNFLAIVVSVNASFIEVNYIKMYKDDGIKDDNDWDDSFRCNIIVGVENLGPYPLDQVATCLSWFQQNMYIIDNMFSPNLNYYSLCALTHGHMQ